MREVTTQFDVYHICHAAPPSALLPIVNRNFTDLSWFRISKHDDEENFYQLTQQVIELKDDEKWVLGYVVENWDEEEYQLLHPNLQSKLSIYYYEFGEEGKRKTADVKYWSPLVAPNEKRYQITYKNF